MPVTVYKGELQPFNTWKNAQLETRLKRLQNTQNGHFNEKGLVPNYQQTLIFSATYKFSGGVYLYVNMMSNH